MQAHQMDFKEKVKRCVGFARLVRRELVNGGAMMIVGVFCLFLAQQSGLIPNLWKDIGVVTIFAVGGLLGIAIIIYFRARGVMWRTASDLYLKQLKAMARLRAIIKELTGDEANGNMSAREVLEFAFKRSGLSTKRDIETALRNAARREKDPIAVYVQRDESVWKRVPQEIFENHAIDLDSPDSAGRIYNINDSKAEEYGWSPYFWRHEIENLWRKREEQLGD